MIVFERRAAGALFNFLRSQPGKGAFLIPANVCPVVPLTFLKAGRRFVGVDIEDETLGMDPDLCLARLSEHPGSWAGVLYVRTYGAITDVTPFFREIKRVSPACKIVDDRCLCPADPEGAGLSPWADLTLYSTGPAKCVDLAGGGFGFLSESVPYRRQAAPFSPVSLRVTLARSERAAGGKFRMRRASGRWLDLGAPAEPWDSYRARVRAAWAAGRRHRRALAAAYHDGLPPEIQLPEIFHDWRFHIRVAHPDRLVEDIFAVGLFASRHYRPIDEGFCDGPFPRARELYSRVVNLFIDRPFDLQKAEAVIAIVRRHVSRSGAGRVVPAPSPRATSEGPAGIRPDTPRTLGSRHER